MDFDTAFSQVVDNEGALSMDPRDRGNWTTGVVNSGTLKGSKYGISAMSYPNLDIENLTLDQAKSIYQRDYWSLAGCEMVPDGIKFDLFDMAVNSGVKAAIRALQTAIGSTPDGVIGSDTLMHVRDMPADRLVLRFNGSRLKSMTQMGAWESQGKGWANRIADNLMRA